MLLQDQCAVAVAFTEGELLKIAGGIVAEYARRACAGAGARVGSGRTVRTA